MFSCALCGVCGTLLTCSGDFCLLIPLLILSKSSFARDLLLSRFVSQLWLLSIATLISLAYSAFVHVKDVLADACMTLSRVLWTPMLIIAGTA